MQEKILLVRVGRLGDMIMVTAAIRLLLDRYPEAQFQILTSADGIRALKDFDERVTQFIHYNRKHPIPFWHRRKIKAQIKKSGFTQIYCFEIKKSFTVLFSDTSAKTHILTHQYHADLNYALRCLKLARQTANPEKSYWINIPVPEAGRKKLASLLQRNGINDNEFLIGLHPSFSGLAKNPIRRNKLAKHKTWPAVHWARLAQLLQDYGQKRGLNIRVVMDLLPQEVKLGKDINRLCQQQITVFSDPPDFQRYKALLARLNLLICPDTGPMHLAAAEKTSVVALFSGKNPDDCGPYADPANYHIIRAEDYSNSELGLSAITPDTVFEACLPFIN